MTTESPSSQTRPNSTRPAIAAILAISAAATAFLFWLIYVHPAAGSSDQFAFLPALNALLNGLSATALLIGYTFIRAHRIKAHPAAMMTAFGFRSQRSVRIFARAECPVERPQRYRSADRLHVYKGASDQGTPRGHDDSLRISISAISSHFCPR